jgi:hypothetical protein
MGGGAVRFASEQPTNAADAARQHSTRAEHRASTDSPYAAAIRSRYTR